MDATVPVASYPKPPDYFTEALVDAERLLKYAAEIGVEVEDASRHAVLEARAAVSLGWTEATAGNLLAPLTRLAAKLKPVTAESLKSYDRRPTARSYWIVAIFLVIVIVPFSVVSFITSGLEALIAADINNAEQLAAKLSGQFEPLKDRLAPADLSLQSGSVLGWRTGLTPEPPGRPGAPQLPIGLTPTDVILDFQKLASVIRSIYGRSLQLNSFILKQVANPFSDANTERIRGSLPVASAVTSLLSSEGVDPRSNTVATDTYVRTRHHELHLFGLWRGGILYSPCPLRAVGNLRVSLAILRSGDEESELHPLSFRLSSIHDCSYFRRHGWPVQELHDWRGSIDPTTSHRIYRRICRGRVLHVPGEPDSGF